MPRQAHITDWRCASAQRQSLLGQVSKWVLGFFIVAAACFAPPDAYAQSGGSNDSVLQAPPSEGEINFVGRKAIQQGFEAVTGGKTRGSRRYSVERWLESTPYRFGTSMLILLWPANDAGLSTAGVLSDDLKTRSLIETQLVKQFDVLERLRGATTTRPIVKFRVVPPGVTFEHLARTYPRDAEKPPLDLVFVAPRPGISLETWVNSLVMTAIHEYTHMLQWDDSRYNEDLYVREAHAYGVQICVTYLANDIVPDIVYKFPPMLQQAVGDYTDIPVAEIISQSREQKEAPTFAGMAAAVLTFHRFFSELKERQDGKPTIGQAEPLCSAIARGHLDWSATEVDRKISEFAKAAARSAAQKAG